MTHWILIISGFFQIGIGVSWWMHTHQIEKVYTETLVKVRGIDGTLLEENHRDAFFEKYKIVKKEAK